MRQIHTPMRWHAAASLLLGLNVLLMGTAFAAATPLWGRILALGTIVAGTVLTLRHFEARERALTEDAAS